MQLLRSLEGHRDLRHRELQTILLRAQPSVLSKCVGAMVIPTLDSSVTNTSSQPPSVSYLCALTQLAYLCSHTDIDPMLKATLRASSAMTKTVSLRADDAARVTGNNDTGTGVDVMMVDPQDDAINVNHANTLHQAIQTLVQVTTLFMFSLHTFPLSYRDVCTGTL